MEEAWRRGRAWSDTDFAFVQIAVVGEENASLLAIDGKGILSCRMRKLIQSRIDSRNEEKKADDQEDESFKKSFHVMFLVAV
jgi:hypothetical protein